MGLCRLVYGKSPPAPGPQPCKSCANTAAKVTVLEHLGSAHTEAELTALLAAGDEKLADYGAAEQLELELGLSADVAGPV